MNKFNLTSSNLLNYIGNTPIIKVKNFDDNKNAATIWAKLENFNPSGSIKDRVAKSILEDAEKKGLVTPGVSTIVEATSGNTGIALAVICSIKNYRLVLVMPKAASFERKQILKSYGAQIIEIESTNPINASIEKAKELAEKNSNYFLFNQFFNKKSANIHTETTAMEIIEQVPSKIDAFVCGIGTGGTITGIGEVIKDANPDCLIVGVEPQKSSVLSGYEPGKHSIEGIGVGFIPEVLNTSVYDKIVRVNYEQAKINTQEIVKKHGLLVGISSGAAFFAAKKISIQIGIGKHIVTIFCDDGERYLSTNLYS